jgi:hypothetical protein
VSSPLLFRPEPGRLVKETRLAIVQCHTIFVLLNDFVAASQPFIQILSFPGF